MRTNVLQLIFLLFFITVTLQIIPFRELSRTSQSDIENDPFIEVTQTSTSKLSDLNREYFTLKVIEKEKRLAYYKMIQIYEKIVKILKKYQLIPDEDSLVKTKIKPQFLTKKRKWSFSIIFVIGGQQQQLVRCYRQMVKIGVQRLSTHPSINFLNEKVQAMDFFNSAKLKLTRQLKKFTNMKIKQVERIEINGMKIQNSDIIEDQIEQQFSDSEEMIDEQEFASIKNSSDNIQDQGITMMKIVFKVGVEDQDSHWEQQQEQDDDDQSQNSEDQIESEQNSEDDI